MMRTANPALNANSFREAHVVGSDSEVMTIDGTVNKTAILVIIAFATAAFTWKTFLSSGEISSIQSWMLLGGIGGFIASLVTIFKKDVSAISAPIYAACEGLFLGGLSSMLEVQYPGIVIQAIALTFGVLFSLLMVYKSGFIKVTDNFRLGIFAATAGIALIYVVSLILSFFGINMPLIHESTGLGIIFSLVVVTIAALNLVLDFDFIEQAAESGKAPKYMEWYGAFGLMVTLVWLYVEILRLLSKIKDRR